MCMDGELWHEMYRSKWPVGIQLEGKIDLEELSLEVSYIMSYIMIVCCTGGKFRVIQDFVLFKNFAGSNSTFHVYNFCVISQRKTRN